MLILADVFMLLSYPRCHGIQYFKLCDINEKKRFDKTFICNSVALFVYIQYSGHRFSTWKQINLSKKNKGRQELYDVNIRAIYGCRQAGTH